MTESEDATFVPTKDNPAIWESKGQNFLKIIRQLTGGTTDTIINFQCQVRCGLPEEMLRQVRECLWLQHATDIGLMMSTKPGA